MNSEILFLELTRHITDSNHYVSTFGKFLRKNNSSDYNPNVVRCGSAIFEISENSMISLQISCNEKFSEFTSMFHRFHFMFYGFEAHEDSCSFLESQDVVA